MNDKSQQTTESFIPWTSPQAYPELISDANQKYNFGIPQPYFYNLESALAPYDHIDDNTPTSVRLWLGGNLEFNWGKMLSWLSDRVQDQGLEILSCVYPDDLKFFDPIEDGNFYKTVKSISKKAKSTPCGLEYDDNIIIMPTRLNLKKSLREPHQYWAGIELLTFLALNPQVVELLDGINLPYLCANGLRAENCVPVFQMSEDREMALITAHWINPRADFRVASNSFPWQKTSLISFD